MGRGVGPEGGASAGGWRGSGPTELGLRDVGVQNRNQGAQSPTTPAIKIRSSFTRETGTRGTRFDSGLTPGKSLLPLWTRVALGGADGADGSSGRRFQSRVSWLSWRVRRRPHATHAHAQSATRASPTNDTRKLFGSIDFVPSLTTSEFEWPDSADERPERAWPVSACPGMDDQSGARVAGSA